MMLMFTTVIAAATFAGRARRLRRAESVLHGDRRRDLRLSVPERRRLVQHPVRLHRRTPVGVRDPARAPSACCCTSCSRRCGRASGVWWDEAKDGGQIAAKPRRYLTLVAAPEAISWLAMLGTIAVFLAAYDIPVTFHTLMSVTGGNSIANMTSVTPGGAGVVQSFNVAVAEERHEREQRDGLLGRAAARRDGVEHRARDPADGAGVRMDRGSRPRRSSPTIRPRRRPPRSRRRAASAGRPSARSARTAARARRRQRRPPAPCGREPLRWLFGASRRGSRSDS